MWEGNGIEGLQSFTSFTGEAAFLPHQMQSPLLAGGVGGSNHRDIGEEVKWRPLCCMLTLRPLCPCHPENLLKKAVNNKRNMRAWCLFQCTRCASFLPWWRLIPKFPHNMLRGGRVQDATSFIHTFFYD